MGSLLIAAVFIALFQFVSIAKANPDSKRLYDDLLSNYNRLIRPVGNNSDRLTVKMGLRLSQLIDVVSIMRCAICNLHINWKKHIYEFNQLIFLPFLPSLRALESQKSGEKTNCCLKCSYA